MHGERSHATASYVVNCLLLLVSCVVPRKKNRPPALRPILGPKWVFRGVGVWEVSCVGASVVFDSAPAWVLSHTVVRPVQKKLCPE